MLTLENEIVDISEIEALASKISKSLEVGDLLMLKGELGVGKTTIAKSIINNLYSSCNLPEPNSINSPTYPILLTYDLRKFEIYHYDFYRIKNIRELEELDFFENIKNTITLIEWPELLIEQSFKGNYYLIKLDLHSENKRIINIKYFK